MTRFDGKHALVTGAASGLGRAATLALAAEGARVLAIDCNERGLAALPGEAPAGSVATHPCDVRERAACGLAVEAALKEFGRLDILLNVAGVNRFHHFTEMPEEDWNLIIGVNLTGAAFMCQAALPALLESEGCIVNVASVAALQGQAYTVAYTASKGGLIQLTRSLAMEYVDRGIRINAVAPGGIDTPMNRDLRFPEGMDWKLARNYVGHRGLAETADVVSVLLFLASDDARAVHGAIWAVDGGITAG